MLKIQNIHKSFNTKKVLNGVDLEVQTGTIQSLLGANGSGKSTLTHIISGIMEYNIGDIYINNSLVTIDNYSYREQIGFVFEKPMYLEKFSAEEYLYFAGRMYKIDKSVLTKRVKDLLLFFDLPDDDQYIENYSKGMKSKVSLAAALVHNPKLLILDEPFDNVDFVTIQKITKLFRSMAVNGCTIFVTSHQYDIIANMCDKFALLKDGKIMLNTSLSELKSMSIDYSNEENPIKSYLEKLMDSNDTINKDLIWLKT